jgi:hypothetical protein
MKIVFWFSRKVVFHFVIINNLKAKAPAAAMPRSEFISQLKHNPFSLYSSWQSGRVWLGWRLPNPCPINKWVQNHAHDPTHGYEHRPMPDPSGNPPQSGTPSGIIFKLFVAAVQHLSLPRTVAITFGGLLAESGSFYRLRCFSQRFTKRGGTKEARRAACYPVYYPKDSMESSACPAFIAQVNTMIAMFATTLFHASKMQLCGFKVEPNGDISWRKTWLNYEA